MHRHGPAGSVVLLGVGATARTCPTLEHTVAVGTAIAILPRECSIGRPLLCGRPLLLPSLPCFVFHMLPFLLPLFRLLRSRTATLQRFL